MAARIVASCVVAASFAASGIAASGIAAALAPITARRTTSIAIVAASTTATASAKIASSIAHRLAAGITRLGRCCFCGTVFLESVFTFLRPAVGGTGLIAPGLLLDASAVLHRAIRRDGLIQIFVLLFEVHEIGDVEERVAFQSDIDKGRLHAGQHARYTALVNRSR